MPSATFVPAVTQLAAGEMGATPKARTIVVTWSDKVLLSNGTILEVHLVSGGARSVYTIDKLDFPGAIEWLGDYHVLTTPRGATSPYAPLDAPGPLTASQLQTLLQEAANAAFEDPASSLLPGSTPPSFSTPAVVRAAAGDDLVQAASAIGGKFIWLATGTIT